MSDPRLLKLTDRMLSFRANVENSPGTKAFGKKLLINSQITWIVMKQKEISLFLDDDDGAQSCLTFTTPWIVTCQAPLPMEFSKQEYWSGLPFFSPGDLPDSGIELESPALASEFFTTMLCYAMLSRFSSVRLCATP